MFESGDIILRKPVGTDAKLMLSWENNVEYWKFSDRSEALSLADIEHLIEEQGKDYFQLDQIRLMVVVRSSMCCIGTVDLYEIDWEKDEAFIGILIADKKFRNKNAAKLAISKLSDLAFKELELSLLKARVQKGNEPSNNLFSSLGFKKKKDELCLDSPNANYIDIFELWQNE